MERRPERRSRTAAGSCSPFAMARSSIAAASPPKPKRSEPPGSRSRRGPQVRILPGALPSNAGEARSSAPFPRAPIAVGFSYPAVSLERSSNHRGRGGGAMLILGVNPGHDGGVVVVGDRQLLYSLESEKDSFGRHAKVTPMCMLNAIE